MVLTCDFTKKFIFQEIIFTVFKCQLQLFSMVCYREVGEENIKYRKKCKKERRHIFRMLLAFNKEKKKKAEEKKKEIKEVTFFFIYNWETINFFFFKKKSSKEKSVVKGIIKDFIIHIPTS